MTQRLERYFGRLERGQPWRWCGQVLESVGQTIESAGPLASVGECCEIHDQFGRAHLGRIILRHRLNAKRVVTQPVELVAIFCHRRFGGIRGGDGVRGKIQNLGDD